MGATHVSSRGDVGDGDGRPAGHDRPDSPTSGLVTYEELQLAARNHGMPLEALRHERTPVGLHYLLIHYDIPVVDPATWRLAVHGRVARPLELGLDDLQARPAVTVPVTLECAGNGRARLSPRPVSQPWLLEAVGTAAWTGTPLAPLLREAGVLDDAVEVVFTGLDRGLEGGEVQPYARSLSVDDALGEGPLLAWGIEGAPLPPQHGFPLRLVVPGWYGMASVKWLAGIEVVDRPFEGYQQAVAYRWRTTKDEPGEPVTRILPRALLAPPGVPDFLTRRRVVEPGPCRLEGRAWSGYGPVVRVEVSDDGGATWWDAELPGEHPAPAAWRPWATTWQATPGDHELCCRATDASGRVQPPAPAWNLGGYTNNAVQRVPVTVAP